MISRTKPTTRCDLLTVCWALSDSGQVVMQFLHQAGEPCTHPAASAAAILRHLRELGEDRRNEIAARLARLSDDELRFWGEGDSCELCEYLRHLTALGAELIERDYFGAHESPETAAA